MQACIYKNLYLGNARGNPFLFTKRHSPAAFFSGAFHDGYLYYLEDIPQVVF